MATITAGAVRAAVVSTGADTFLVRGGGLVRGAIAPRTRLLASRPRFYAPRGAPAAAPRPAAATIPGDREPGTAAHRPVYCRIDQPRSRSAAVSTGRRRGLHHQLDQTRLLPGGVLDADVLDVDPRASRVGEDTGQLAGLVADEDGDDSRTRPGRRRACRGRGPGPRCRGAGRPRCRRRPRVRLASSADCSARSAWTVSSRSAATSARTSATGPGFAERMSIHIRGSEAAIRVTSRMPWPHSRTAVSSACSRRAATMLEISCGVWETRATARSWASASMTTGTARQSATSSRARLSTSVSRVPGRGQHPGAPLEEVGGGGQRARALLAGHRVRTDVRGQVEAERLQLAARAALDAGHVEVAAGDPAPHRVGQRRGDVGGRHGDDREVDGPRGLLVGARAERGRRTGLVGVVVGEVDGDAAPGQGQRGGGADQAGSDDECGSHWAMSLRSAAAAPR